jgi:hypothetical protein
MYTKLIWLEAFPYFSYQKISFMTSLQDIISYEIWQSKKYVDSTENSGQSWFINGSLKRAMIGASKQEKHEN